MPNADLSIIVPTLNEEKNIRSLLESLHRQKNIQIELIIVDGGSSDHTLTLIEEFLEQHSLNCNTISSDPGRGLQMNRGAAVVTADELLFLHADSIIDDVFALQTACGFLKEHRNKLGHDRLAGHFALQFERSQAPASLAYYFFESKTHLNRLDTINGDQGLMLSKDFFQSLGGFDQSLAFMEDARLARKIYATGQWITLPGRLTTSARRFETEGLRQRQILNALLCNFEHIGLQEFFNAAANAYRSQDKTRPLDLKPFFQLTHRLISRQGVIAAIKLWYRTGYYVASNAWQLAFAWDCRRNFTLMMAPGRGSTPTLRYYDAWLAPMINSLPGRFAAMVLALIWFYSVLLFSGLRR